MAKVFRWKSLWVLTLVSQLLYGCSSATPDAEQGATNTSSPSSPAVVNSDAQALQAANLTQEKIDERFRPGAVEIAARPIEEIRPYGEVLLVEIESTKRDDLETSAVVMIALSETADDLRQQGEFPDVEYAGLADPSGAVALAKVDDMVAWATDSMSSEDFYNSLIYIDI